MSVTFLIKKMILFALGVTPTDQLMEVCIKLVWMIYFLSTLEGIPLLSHLKSNNKEKIDITIKYFSYKIIVLGILTWLKITRA